MNRILCEWNPEKILGIFLRLECAFHMLDGFLANSYHIHHILTIPNIVRLCCWIWYHLHFYVLWTLIFSRFKNHWNLDKIKILRALLLKPIFKFKFLGEIPRFWREVTSCFSLDIGTLEHDFIKDLSQILIWYHF